jgi:DNA-directed RNA polymerase subunit RPC12/RpoP
MEALMSDDWQTIVDVDATAGEARRLGESLRRWLLDEGIVSADTCPGPEGVAFLPGPRFTRAVGLGYATSEGIDGVTIETGRRVFDSGENGVELTCASCGTTFAVEFQDDAAWTEAVEAWDAGADDARFACPSCGTRRRLVEWRGPWP